MLEAIYFYSLLWKLSVTLEACWEIPMTNYRRFNNNNNDDGDDNNNDNAI